MAVKGGILQKWAIYLDFGQTKKEKNANVDKSLQKEDIFEKATAFGG